MKVRIRKRFPYDRYFCKRFHYSKWWKLDCFLIFSYVISNILFSHQAAYQPRSSGNSAYICLPQTNYKNNHPCIKVNQSKSIKLIFLKIGEISHSLVEHLAVFETAKATRAHSNQRTSVLMGTLNLCEKKTAPELAKPALGGINLIQVMKHFL